MTSEELIVLLDSLQPRLPKCATPVLLRLVARCIKSGTNEVEASDYELSVELNMSRDAIRVAGRALTPLIQVTSSKGIAKRWTLPAQWFTVQRELFAVVSPVEKVVNWTSNQATVAWKPGQSPDEKPGYSSLETRPQWKSFQASVTSNQATGSLETRLVVQENQQDATLSSLETRPPSIDRHRGLSSVEGVLLLRDSIEGVNRLPDELRAHGETLKGWLRSFFSEVRPGQPIPDGPDEIILAKCLAIAPLGSLGPLMKKLLVKPRKCGDNWAWWVTVFCQRIHRTQETASVRAHPAFHEPKKPASHESGGQFSADLLQNVTAAVRTM